MKGYTAVCRGFLSADECQRLIGMAQKHVPAENALVGHGGKSVQHDMRVSTIRFIKRGVPLFRQLWERVDALMSRINAENFGFNLVGVPYELQFTEYHFVPGAEGKYDWHRDDNMLGTMALDRKLSMSIPLSHRDMYDGGVLELGIDGRSLTPKPEEFGAQGDAIAFPSSLLHRVTQVTRGSRYSLVVWWRGQ